MKFEVVMKKQQLEGANVQSADELIGRRQGLLWQVEKARIEARVEQFILEDFLKEKEEIIYEPDIADWW